MQVVGVDGRVIGYLFCFLILQAKLTNSRTSWRLSADKVVKTTEFVSTVEDDPIFDILSSSIGVGNGQSWSRTAVSEKHEKIQPYCQDCKNVLSGNHERRFSSYVLKDTPNATEQFPLSSQASGEQVMCTSGQQCEDIILDCGKPVNFTNYDNLLGVANRDKHPLVPEPNVTLMFKKNGGKTMNVDIDLLAKRLIKAKREKPKSVQLYNQIGNFWRIKGDAQRSIECFRRALAVSPHNAEVLLNLARVLLAQQYLDDATHLARRSLELQPPDRNAWEQYLTLGQIFKAYGHYQEAAIHLRHALELKPDLSEAAEALREVESLPAASIHIYTLLIIICLVLGVLLVVLSNVECDEDSSLVNGQLQRPVQRHFSRAMAMRSLRLNVARNKRC
ncbi:PREDICTED: uncharacterized protein LOC107191119 [Dufourea novaeangliae]|uniref:Tetratricopeptide repeat protein 17 n=1 Tax=Dufourea novaeangliae TaxID=178035 RepID=A0A154PMC5_DUFNO|nr:PREDICTED: uncharacterized protein LOC107191119 [Dufourea novaeangliae]KZC13009.1 Tetratricopeptide repeat protein 17 [Dufourea novaeangliae]